MDADERICRTFKQEFRKQTVLYSDNIDGRLFSYGAALSVFAKCLNNKPKSQQIIKTWDELMRSVVQSLLNHSQQPSEAALRKFDDMLQRWLVNESVISEIRENIQVLHHLAEDGAWSSSLLQSLLKGEPVDSTELSELLDKENPTVAVVRLQILNVDGQENSVWSLINVALSKEKYKTNNMFQKAFQTHAVYCKGEKDLLPLCEQFDFKATLEVIDKFKADAELQKMTLLCDTVLTYMWKTDTVNMATEMTSKWCEINLAETKDMAEFASLVKDRLTTAAGPASVTHCLILMQTIWEMVGDSCRILCVDILMRALYLLRKEEDQDNQNKIRILETIARLLPASSVARLCAASVFFLEPCIETYFMVSEAFRKKPDLEKEQQRVELKTELTLYMSDQFPPGYQPDLSDWDSMKEECLARLTADDICLVQQEEARKSPQDSNASDATGDTSSSSMDVPLSPTVVESTTPKKCQNCTEDQVCASCEGKEKEAGPHKKKKKAKKKKYGWTCPVVTCKMVSGRMFYLCHHLRTKHGWDQEEISAFTKSLGVSKRDVWTAASDNFMPLSEGGPTELMEDDKSLSPESVEEPSSREPPSVVCKDSLIGDSQSENPTSVEDSPQDERIQSALLQERQRGLQTAGVESQNQPDAMNLESSLHDATIGSSSIHDEESNVSTPSAACGSVPSEESTSVRNDVVEEVVASKMPDLAAESHIPNDSHSDWPPDPPPPPDAHKAAPVVNQSKTDAAVKRKDSKTLKDGMKGSSELAPAKKEPRRRSKSKSEKSIDREKKAQDGPTKPPSSDKPLISAPHNSHSSLSPAALEEKEKHKKSRQHEKKKKEHKHKNQDKPELTHPTKNGKEKFTSPPSKKKTETSAPTSKCETEQIAPPSKIKTEKTSRLAPKKVQPVQPLLQTKGTSEKAPAAKVDSKGADIATKLRPEKPKSSSTPNLSVPVKISSAPITRPAYSSAKATPNVKKSSESAPAEKRPPHPGYLCPAERCDRIFIHKHTIIAHLKFRHHTGQSDAERLAENAKEAVTEDSLPPEPIEPEPAPPTTVDNKMLCSRGWYLRVDTYIHEDEDDSEISPPLGKPGIRNCIVDCLHRLFNTPPTNFNYNSASKYISSSWPALTKASPEAAIETNFSDVFEPMVIKTPKKLVNKSVPPGRRPSREGRKLSTEERPSTPVNDENVEGDSDPDSDAVKSYTSVERAHKSVQTRSGGPARSNKDYEILSNYHPRMRKVSVDRAKHNPSPTVLSGLAFGKTPTRTIAVQAKHEYMPGPTKSQSPKSPKSSYHTQPAKPTDPGIVKKDKFKKPRPLSTSVPPPKADISSAFAVMKKSVDKGKKDGTVPVAENARNVLKTPNKGMSFEDALTDTTGMKSDVDGPHKAKHHHRTAVDSEKRPLPTSVHGEIRQKRSVSLDSSSSDSHDRPKIQKFSQLSELSLPGKSDKHIKHIDKRKHKKSHRKHSQDAPGHAVTRPQDTEEDLSAVEGYQDLLKRAEEVSSSRNLDATTAPNSAKKWKIKKQHGPSATPAGQPEPTPTDASHKGLKKVRVKPKRSIDLRKLSSISPEEEISSDAGKWRKSSSDETTSNASERNNPLSSMLSEASPAQRDSSVDGNTAANQESSHKCNMCGKKMTSRFALTCHMRKKHKIKTKMFIPDDSANDDAEHGHKPKKRRPSSVADGDSNNSKGDGPHKAEKSKEAKNDEPVHAKEDATRAQAESMTEILITGHPSDYKQINEDLMDDFFKVFYSASYRRLADESRALIVRSTNPMKSIYENMYMDPATGRSKCPFPTCNASLIARRTLKSHTRTVHEFDITDVIEYTAEVLVTDSLKKCFICKITFSDFESLEKHIEDNIDCRCMPVLKKLERTSKADDVALRKATKLGIPCLMCGKLGFSSIRSVTDHIRKSHNVSVRKLKESGDMEKIKKEAIAALRRLSMESHADEQYDADSEDVKHATAPPDKDVLAAPEEAAATKAAGSDNCENAAEISSDAAVSKDEMKELECSPSEFGVSSENPRQNWVEEETCNQSDFSSFEDSQDEIALGVEKAEEEDEDQERESSSVPDETFVEETVNLHEASGYVTEKETSSFTEDEFACHADVTVETDVPSDSYSSQEESSTKSPAAGSTHLRRLAYTQAARKIAMKTPEDFNRKRWAEFQNLSYLYNKRSLKKVSIALAPAPKMGQLKEESVPTATTTKHAPPDSEFSGENLAKKCWLCKDTFEKQANYSSHILHHLRSIDRFNNRCDFPGCLYAFKTAEELNEHQLLHDDGMYLCLFCSNVAKPITASWELLEHERQNHPLVFNILPRLRNEFCVNAFPKVERRLLHMSTGAVCDSDSEAHCSSDQSNTEHFLGCGHRKRDRTRPGSFCRCRDNDMDVDCLCEAGVAYCDSAYLRGFNEDAQCNVCDIMTDILDTIDEADTAPLSVENFETPVMKVTLSRCDAVIPAGSHCVNASKATAPHTEAEKAFPFINTATINNTVAEPSKHLDENDVDVVNQKENIKPETATEDSISVGAGPCIRMDDRGIDYVIDLPDVVLTPVDVPEANHAATEDEQADDDLELCISDEDPDAFPAGMSLRDECSSSDEWQPPSKAGSPTTGASKCAFSDSDSFCLSDESFSEDDMPGPNVAPMPYALNRPAQRPNITEPIVCNLTTGSSNMSTNTNSVAGDTTVPQAPTVPIGCAVTAGSSNVTTNIDSAADDTTVTQAPAIPSVINAEQHSLEQVVKCVSTATKLADDTNLNIAAARPCMTVANLDQIHVEMDVKERESPSPRSLVPYDNCLQPSILDPQNGALQPLFQAIADGFQEEGDLLIAEAAVTLDWMITKLECMEQCDRLSEMGVSEFVGWFTVDEHQYQGVKCCVLASESTEQPEATASVHADDGHSSTVHTDPIPVLQSQTTITIIEGDGEVKTSAVECKVSQEGMQIDKTRDDMVQPVAAETALQPRNETLAIVKSYKHESSGSQHAFCFSPFFDRSEQFMAVPRIQGDVKLEIKLNGDAPGVTRQGFSVQAIEWKVETPESTASPSKSSKGPLFVDEGVRNAKKELTEPGQPNNPSIGTSSELVITKAIHVKEAYKSIFGPAKRKYCDDSEDLFMNGVYDAIRLSRQKTKRGKSKKIRLESVLRDPFRNLRGRMPKHVRDMTCTELPEQWHADESIFLKMFPSMANLSAGGKKTKKSRSSTGKPRKVKRSKSLDMTGPDSRMSGLTAASPASAAILLKSPMKNKPDAALVPRVEKLLPLDLEARLGQRQRSSSESTGYARTPTFAGYASAPMAKYAVTPTFAKPSADPFGDPVKRAKKRAHAEREGPSMKKHVPGQILPVASSYGPVTDARAAVKTGHFTKVYPKAQHDQGPGKVIPFRRKLSSEQNMMQLSQSLLQESIPCGTCLRKIVAKDLLEHMLNHVLHPQNVYQCDFLGSMCFFKCKTHHELLVHRTRHTGPKPYLCMFCPDAFKCRNDAETHRTTKHRLFRDLFYRELCARQSKIMSILEENPQFKIMAKRVEYPIAHIIKANSERTGVAVRATPTGVIRKVTDGNIQPRKLSIRSPAEVAPCSTVSTYRIVPNRKTPQHQEGITADRPCTSSSIRTKKISVEDPSAVCDSEKAVIDFAGPGAVATVPRSTRTETPSSSSDEIIVIDLGNERCQSPEPDKAPRVRKLKRWHASPGKLTPASGQNTMQRASNPATLTPATDPTRGQKTMERATNPAILTHTSEASRGQKTMVRATYPVGSTPASDASRPSNPSSRSQASSVHPKRRNDDILSCFPRRKIPEYSIPKMSTTTSHSEHKPIVKDCYHSEWNSTANMDLAAENAIEQPSVRSDASHLETKITKLCDQSEQNRTFDVDLVAENVVEQPSVTSNASHLETKITKDCDQSEQNCTFDVDLVAENVLGQQSVTSDASPAQPLLPGQGEIATPGNVSPDHERPEFSQEGTPAKTMDESDSNKNPVLEPGDNTRKLWRLESFANNTDATVQSQSPTVEQPARAESPDCKNLRALAEVCSSAKKIQETGEVERKPAEYATLEEKVKSQFPILSTVLEQARKQSVVDPTQKESVKWLKSFVQTEPEKGTPTKQKPKISSCSPVSPRVKRYKIKVKASVFRSDCDIERLRCDKDTLSRDISTITNSSDSGTTLHGAAAITSANQANIANVTCIDTTAGTGTSEQQGVTDNAVGSSGADAAVCDTVVVPAATDDTVNHDGNAVGSSGNEDATEQYSGIDSSGMDVSGVCKDEPSGSDIATLGGKISADDDIETQGGRISAGDITGMLSNGVESREDTTGGAKPGDINSDPNVHDSIAKLADRLEVGEKYEDYNPFVSEDGTLELGSGLRTPPTHAKTLPLVNFCARSTTASPIYTSSRSLSQMQLSSSFQKSPEKYPQPISTPLSTARPCAITPESLGIETSAMAEDFGTKWSSSEHHDGLGILCVQEPNVLPDSGTPPLQTLLSEPASFQGQMLPASMTELNAAAQSDGPSNFSRLATVSSYKKRASREKVAETARTTAVGDGFIRDSRFGVESSSARVANSLIVNASFLSTTKRISPVGNIALPKASYSSICTVKASVSPSVAPTVGINPQGVGVGISAVVPIGVGPGGKDVMSVRPGASIKSRVIYHRPASAESAPSIVHLPRPPLQRTNLQFLNVKPFQQTPTVPGTRRVSNLAETVTRKNLYQPGLPLSLPSGPFGETSVSPLSFIDRAVLSTNLPRTTPMSRRQIPRLITIPTATLSAQDVAPTSKIYRIARPITRKVQVVRPVVRSTTSSRPATSTGIQPNPGPTRPTAQPTRQVDQTDPVDSSYFTPDTSLLATSVVSHVTPSATTDSHSVVDPSLTSTESHPIRLVETPSIRAAVITPVSTTVPNLSFTNIQPLHRGLHAEATALTAVTVPGSRRQLTLPSRPEAPSTSLDPSTSHSRSPICPAPITNGIEQGPRMPPPVQRKDSRADISALAVSSNYPNSDETGMSADRQRRPSENEENSIVNIILDDEAGRESGVNNTNDHFSSTDEDGDDSTNSDEDDLDYKGFVQCHLCRMIFTEEEQLKEHCVEVHMEVACYFPGCEVFYTNPTEMKKHLRVAHNVKAEEESPAEDNKFMSKDLEEAVWESENNFTKKYKSDEVPKYMYDGKVETMEAAIDVFEDMKSYCIRAKCWHAGTKKCRQRPLLVDSGAAVVTCPLHDCRFACVSTDRSRYYEHFFTYHPTSRILMFLQSRFKKMMQDRKRAQNKVLDKKYNKKDKKKIRECQLITMRCRFQGCSQTFQQPKSSRERLEAEIRSHMKDHSKHCDFVRLRNYLVPIFKSRVQLKPIIRPAQPMKLGQRNRSCDDLRGVRVGGEKLEPMPEDSDESRGSLMGTSSLPGISGIAFTVDDDLFRVTTKKPARFSPCGVKVSRAMFTTADVVSTIQRTNTDPGPSLFRFSLHGGCDGFVSGESGEGGAASGPVMKTRHLSLNDSPPKVPMVMLQKLEYDI